MKKTLVEVIKESIPTLVVFEHAMKQDSVELKHIVDDLKKKYDGKANIIRVDCSYNGQYKEWYRLNEYPSYVLFKEGQELMREGGRKTEGQLIELVERAM